MTEHISPDQLRKHARLLRAQRTILQSEIDALFKKLKSDLKNHPEYKVEMLHTLEFVFGWYDELLNTESARAYLSDGYKFLKSFYREINS